MNTWVAATLQLLFSAPNSVRVHTPPWKPVWFKYQEKGLPNPWLAGRGASAFLGAVAVPFSGGQFLLVLTTTCYLVLDNFHPDECEAVLLGFRPASPNECCTCFMGVPDTCITAGERTARVFDPF